MILAICDYCYFLCVNIEQLPYDVMSCVTLLNILELTHPPNHIKEIKQMK